MSSHEKRVWNTPAEENLAALMNNASTFLAPSESYSLDLKLLGVRPDDDTFIEIGDRFQARLDHRLASNFRFSADNSNHKLQLEAFEFPLPNDSGSLNLNRTVPSEIIPYSYIPSVDVLGKRHEAKAPAWSERWQENLEQHLTQGHNLDIYIPLDAPHDYYHLWLGHEILSKCERWWMMEKATIGCQMMGRYATKVSVMRRQDVPHNALLSTETVSIIYDTINLENTNGPSITKRLDLISTQDQQQFIRKTFKRSKSQSRNRRTASQSPSRGAEEQDISYFTDVVQRALDNA